MQCCTGPGICAWNPVLPLDQPRRAGITAERRRGSIEAARGSAKHACNSFCAQNPTQADIARSGSTMKHANAIPNIQHLLSLRHERNRNCEEPVKGQARSRYSLLSPFTEPAQVQANPQLGNRKKKSEISLILLPSYQRSQHVSPIPA